MAQVFPGSRPRRGASDNKYERSYSEKRPLAAPVLLFQPLC